jgi:hypothetical protein
MRQIRRGGLSIGTGNTHHGHVPRGFTLEQRAHERHGHTGIGHHDLRHIEVEFALHHEG